MSRDSLWHRKIVAPVLGVLRQGITPRKLAWSLALGAVIGLFPILGVTSVLCAVIAVPLRLNMVVIQAACWAVTPLELALVLPLIRLGERLFHAPPLPLSGAQLVALFKAGLGQALSQAGGSILLGIVAWLLVAIPATLGLYALLRPPLGWWLARRASAAAAAPPSPPAAPPG